MVKINFNLEKKHILFFVGLVVIVGLGFVLAQIPNPGHSSSQIALSDDVTLGDVAPQLAALNTAGGDICTSSNSGDGNCADASGGGSQWTNIITGDGGIYYSGGNVGIGTEHPYTPLHVVYPYSKFDTTARFPFTISSNDASDQFKLFVGAIGAQLVENRVFYLQTGDDYVFNDGILALQPGEGNVGIGTLNPGQKLDIAGGNGRVESGYSWLTNSDMRLKKDVTTLSEALDKISRLRGVRYNLNETNESRFGKHIGFIAQELEKEYPELVVTGEDGIKSVAYDKLTAPIVEAIKELRAEKDKEIEQLREENKEIKEIVCRDHPNAEVCK